MPARRDELAFTLIELLVVIGIIVLMMVLLVPAFTTMKGAGEVSVTAHAIRDALRQARMYAVANSTFVWVGFFEESVNSTGTAGTGRVVMSIVASKDGSRVYSETVNDPPALDQASLVQVGKLLKFENIHLERLSDAAVPRTDVPPDSYHVGHDAFAKRIQFDQTEINNRTTFQYPITGTAEYTFTKVIEFDPRGVSSKIVDSPVRVIEIGLRPTRGPSIDTNTVNVAAIQIAGISGQAQVLRR